LPNGGIHRLAIGPFRKSFREAPLTATVLAALVPPECDYEIQIVDESIQAIPFHKTYELVAISILTGTAIRGYEIARRFKHQGATVVIGGVHVSLRPEEVSQYADSIVIGFAEKTWPQLLRDFENSCLKAKYEDHEQHFENLPTPRRDLQKKSRYMVPNVVSATRGCKNNCDFCTVPVAGFQWHVRPLGEVVDEIRNIRSRKLVFNDVSMGEDMSYFKALLKAMVPLRKKWGGLVSTKVFNDLEVMDLLVASGCIYLLIGFETLNSETLSNINKGFNQVEKYVHIIHMLRQHKIILMGCFIFGFEEDDLDIFRKTVAFVNTNKVAIPRYAVYTPYPGTPSFRRLMSEGRILHQWWNYYDTQHVVFRPKKMTVEELQNGFVWAYNDTFKTRSCLKRTITSGKNLLLTFGGNMAYKLYLSRLNNSHKDKRLIFT